MAAVTKMRRHGDVLLKTRDGFAIPIGVNLVPMPLLHRGANHDHSVKSGKAVHGELDSKRYMRVTKKLTLDHPEHGQGDVPPGDYWVEIKSEYDHLENESRQVVD